MWPPIITAIISFILTGLIGGRLLQKWQLRNWLNQQKFLGAEKDYIALQELFDDIVALSGQRLHKTRRLFWALRRANEEVIEQRVREYDEVTISWNEKINSYYVRLTFYADFHMAKALERDVHSRFARLGGVIEEFVRQRRAGGSSIALAVLARLQRDLDRMQGQLFSFNRDLLRSLEEKRQAIYYGVRLHLTKDTLELFSTWDLLKALFKPRKEQPSIVRPAADFG